MEICHHCHNVLSKNADRCTVCGVERADPAAADVRRRDGLDPAAHAPGWAAPLVEQPGIHPEEFVRELTGEAPPPAAQPAEPAPVLPPRDVPATPPPGALAGYLGVTVQRGETGQPTPAGGPGDAPPPPPPGTDPTQNGAPPPAYFGQHLSTATKVTPDGVAARTTRLDGTVKLGPRNKHQLLTLGAPLLAGLIVAASVAGALSVSSTEADTATAPTNGDDVPADLTPAIEATGAVVTIELDGCGIVASSTGFVFADQSVLSTRSDVKTDNRPTIVFDDGTTTGGQIVGWSQVTNVAVIRTDDDLVNGLRWGVSSRLREGDAVSVLAITAPGVAEPQAATISKVSTRNGTVSEFELDTSVGEGSLVLDSMGFVVGMIGPGGAGLPSDDLSPAISRIRLSDDRPQAECPPPPATTTTVPVDPDTEGTNDGTPNDDTPGDGIPGDGDEEPQSPSAIKRD